MFLEPGGQAKFDADLIVVGGGLAGLIAAAKVAGAGRSVIVLEKSRHWGGRAATHVKNSLHLNLGAHALYCHGHAYRILRELDAPFTGQFPNPGQGILLEGSREYPLPNGTWSLLTSPMLTIREKLQFIRLLSRLPEIQTGPLNQVTLGDWIAGVAGSGRLAALLCTLFRLNTYVDAPELFSAGVAIEQFQLGLAGNVWYLDGGWQTLIDGLRQRASLEGTIFRAGAAARSVRTQAHGVEVALSDGTILRSRTVVLAVPPKIACQLLALPESHSLTTWTERSPTLRAACLDVCLEKLLRPANRFALGLDRPVYFSVHSAAAKLAAPGVAVIHLMKYLREENKDSSESIEKELEVVLDQLQPGWREHVIELRFLPRMTVAYHLPKADERGLAGRPAVSLSDQPGVFLTGDWVGPRGLLADASAASAEVAAAEVLKSLVSSPATSFARGTYVGA